MAPLSIIGIPLDLYLVLILWLIGTACSEPGFCDYLLKQESVWNNLDLSTCGYLKKTRKKKAKYKEGTGKLQIQRDGQILEVPLCLIPEDQPCVTRNRFGKEHEDESIEFVQHWMYQLFSKQKVQWNTSMRIRPADLKGTEEADLDMWSWGCISGVCSKEKKCTAGKRNADQVWKAYENPEMARVLNLNKGSRICGTGRIPSNSLLVLAAVGLVFVVRFGIW